MTPEIYLKNRILGFLQTFPRLTQKQLWKLLISEPNYKIGFALEALVIDRIVDYDDTGNYYVKT